MSVVRAGLAGLLLSGCVGATAFVGPMTMPPPDGRAQSVKVGGQDFVVNRQLNETVSLRVTRVGGRDLDYSDGALAKKAVLAFCATFNRGLDPASIGRFSLPNAWVFGGDCL